jgi:hypothetical protein
MVIGYFVHKIFKNRKVAYDWIMRIRRETGYFGEQSIIEKVIVDRDKDITDKVRK